MLMLSFKMASDRSDEGPIASMEPVVCGIGSMGGDRHLARIYGLPSLYLHWLPIELFHRLPVRQQHSQTK